MDSQKGWFAIEDFFRRFNLQSIQITAGEVGSSDHDNSSSVFLADLRNHLYSHSNSSSFSQLSLHHQKYEERRRKKLTMMVIPAFLYQKTEDWSFTFYEGLNRHPDSISKDKTLSELGCGNGWISIALSDKWFPLKEMTDNLVRTTL